MPNPSPPHLLPETMLTIYCLEGNIPDNQLFPPGFLGNWQEDGYAFLFFLQPEEFFVDRLVKNTKGLSLVDSYRMSYRDWQGGSIEPIRIGRLIVNPPWLKAAPGPGEYAVTLDAGVVFGNGTHPTTLACLNAIEIACHGGNVDVMLDLGTGSGLLALAAARLGCRRIMAVDNNELAARTARRNVELNRLDEKIVVITGLAESFVSTAADLLVANIGYEAMLGIITSPGFLQQKWFVLSGLQTREAEKILVQLAELPVLVLKKWQSGPIWQTIMGITRERN